MDTPTATPPADDARRKARLLNHRDTVLLDVAGEEEPWLLGAAAFRIAEAKGIKPGALLASLQAAGDNTEAGYDAFCKLVWVGTLPFDEARPEHDVTDFLSFPDMLRMLPQMMDAINEAVDQEAAGKAAAGQGKADRKKR